MIECSALFSTKEQSLMMEDRKEGIAEVGTGERVSRGLRGLVLDQSMD